MHDLRKTPDSDAFIRFFETKLGARLRKLGTRNRKKSVASED
jgi:hypothetical protein